MTGGRVEIWDRDRVGDDDLLGLAVIGAGGFYTIRHASLRDIYAKVFDRSGACRYISKVYPKYSSGFLALNFRIARGRLATDGVAGQLLWVGGDPAILCLVQLFSAGATRHTLVASAVVNEHGWYAIPAPRAGRYYIRVTDPAGETCRFISPEVRKDGQVCLSLNASINPNADVFRVSGRVTLSEPGGSSQGVANAIVSAYDWDRFTSTDQLGSARTDTGGHYSISFRPRDFDDERYENPNRPDILVAVAIHGAHELTKTSDVTNDAAMPHTENVHFDLSRVEGHVARYDVCSPDLGVLVERPRDLLRVRLRRSAGLVGWHQLGEAAVDANGDFKIEWDGTYADERDLPHELRFYEGDTHRRTVPLEVSTGALIYRPTIDIEIPCAEVTAPAPDLLAEIDLDPDMPTYDDVAFRVRGAVSNVGGEASGPFKAVLYFVNEGAPGGGSWTAVRTVQSEGLAPRESLMIEHQQPALPAGTYRFCMVADQGEEVAEASESNNAAWWRFAIRER
ncbi:MAG: hypothetical protein KC420_04125 [Myxococcales bacterium]|nr:hypothetical protein [Myxococcales bacterium]